MAFLIAAKLFLYLVSLFGQVAFLKIKTSATFFFFVIKSTLSFFRELFFIFSRSIPLPKIKINF